MYELYFETPQVFFHALGSDPGRNLMSALKDWADARLITWFYTESFEEEATQYPDRER
jgi:hypothetical protein